MVDLFLEAVSLTLEKRLGTEDTVNGQAISSIGLKELTASASILRQAKGGGQPGRIPYVDGSMVYSLPPCGSGKNVSDDVVRALCRLKNLESLCLCVPCFEQTGLEPTIERRGVRMLTIGVQLFVDKRDELLSP